jgi:hypothetical protein
MAEKSLDEKLHDMDEANKIYEFAETVLGCNDKQADIMSRTMRHKFKWSGVRLLWNGGAGDQPVVAVDHVDQIREYFARENYDFLLPTPKAAVDGFPEAASIPGDVLDAALNGSQTAKGKICLLLGGNNADAAARTELLLKTERAKRDGANSVGDNPHGTTQAERRTTSTNPFTRLRVNGVIDKKVEAQVASMIVAMGTKRVSDIARAAVGPNAPFGLSITGLPLAK